MKSLLLAILLIVLSIPNVFSQVNIEEKYFHELKGFEDSTGTTQLFYRLYEPNIFECSYTDNGNTYTGNVNTYKNHVRHYNTIAQTDSVSLKDFVKIRPMCNEIPQHIEGYIYLHNDPAKPVALYESVFGLQGSSTMETFDNKTFGIGFDNPGGLNFHESTNSIILTSPRYDFIPKAKPDYNPILKKTYRFPLDQDSLWNERNYYYDYPDSLLIDFSVLGISDSEKNVFIGFKDSDLVISYDSGNSIEIIYNDFFNTHPIYAFEAEFKPLIFDPANPVFYIRNQYDFTHQGKTSNIIRVNRVDDAWLTKNLLPNSNSKRISNDPANSGHLYLSDSTKIYFSEDSGDTMQEILEFDSEVTGLYKKPNSGILYVLTRTDLYKVENGTPTSIKQVPVSRENEAEIPNSVSLHQNFPNPFNPSTTIQFELNETAFTKLTVYDLLGRKVRELVNEVRPAGTNTIQFNATHLASGIYLYQLEANGIVQTKLLTLIK